MHSLTRKGFRYFAESFVAADHGLEPGAVVGVRMTAEHVDQRGEGLDVGAGHGADRDRLPRPAVSHCLGDGLQPGELLAVDLARQVECLRLVAQVPDEHARSEASGRDQGPHVVELGAQFLIRVSVYVPP